MKIGILTPSIYMYQKRYSDRIFAIGELVRHLISGLLARGHQVTWLSAPEKTAAQLVAGDVHLLDNDLAIRTFQDITPEVKDKISLFGSKMYYEMDLLTRGYGQAKQEKFDLIHHFHSFGFLAHFFEELTAVPTLYTLHDPIPKPDMLEFWLFQRFPAHKFLSVSKSQQGSLAPHFFDYVYNGIDLSEFAFKPEIGHGFIAVGRMTAEKGFDTAIAAAKETQVPLTIASWINKNVENSDFYQTKIKPWVDGTTIKIDGLLQANDRVRLYQQAQALLFPIAWEEPFGMVMIESMACGTPVIAYNRGSVAEVVKDGITGFIIDPDNESRPGKGNWIIKQPGIAGLVEAIKRIGEIDRANCRKHVEENFTIEKMVEGYERVYQRVINEKQ